jgi:hypothetical protein
MILRGVAASTFAAVAILSCSAGSDNGKLFPGGNGEGGATGWGGAGGSMAGTGGSILFDAGDDGSGGGGFVTNPTTCAQSQASHSYIGCDYWPTVTANNVWSIFDYAVVVANTGSDPADVTVTGPNGVNVTETVLVNTLKTIYLPWVKALKGADCDNCGSAVPPSGSMREDGGAYHLVATRPVTVYQFNALEYKGQGGPSGKNWSGCPGDTMCIQYYMAVGCFSFSNDASLLLPSTAMTSTYRVASSNGWEVQGQAVMPPYVTITATTDGTEVEFKTTGKVLAGGGLGAASPGGTVTFSMNAGDVVQLVSGSTTNDDFSGSLVISNAGHPIQVITGMPCRNVPDGQSACDHIEESMFPAETLGKEYVVSVPAGPNGGKAPGQWVRIIGNVDGTTLTFDPPINGGTAAVNAASVLDLGIQANDFKVSGDHEFIVETFMQGGSVVDPQAEVGKQKGDPAQSLATAIEQYRDTYVFLAPDDYDVNYVNIMAPPGTTVTLDEQQVSNSEFTAVGASGISVARVQLAPTGTHTLKSSNPVGIQVYGYGAYTSYQYPGGLNLKSIAPPPLK